MKYRRMDVTWKAIVAGVLCPALLQAQDSTQCVFTEQFQREYNFFAREAITQPLMRLPQYSLLEAKYTYTSGDYHLSQDAAKQQDMTFYTEGTKQVKRILVSGLFSYQRIVQDSVGNTLRDGLYDAAPFYLYAAKKGSWEMGRYHLQGIASTRLLHDRLTVGAGVSYEGNNAWRSNDPRPESFSSDMNVKLTVHYRLLPHHTIGVQGGLLFKSSESTVEYRNTDYSLSLLYPEYITYLQYGYGLGALHISNRTVMSKTDGWQWQGIYDGRYSFGDITLKGGYTRQDGKFYRNRTLTDAGAQYGRFYEDITNVSLYWKLSKPSWKWSAQVDYYDQLGQDFNALLNGNNYIYSFEQLKVQLMLSYIKNQQVQYEVGLPVTVSNLYRADGTVGLRTNYQYMNVGASGAFYHYKDDSRKWWKAGLQLAMQLPVLMEINTPLMVTDFMKNVVYPDYLYTNASTVTIRADWRYHFPVHKTRTFLKIEGQYVHANVKGPALPANSIPGNNRWFVQTSIGLSL